VAGIGLRDAVFRSVASIGLSEKMPFDKAREKRAVFFFGLLDRLAEARVIRDQRPEISELQKKEGGEVTAGER
jgi:hypothetical protein